MDEQERRAAELAASVNGGPGVDYSHSLRGRIHHMQSAMASADKLREAAQAVERAQREQAHATASLHGRRWSRLTQALVVACAVVTAAAPYVLHFAG